MMQQNAVTIDKVLQEGLHALQVQANARQKALLLQYLSLLMKWNEHFNLTAIREPLAMVAGHLLDSLSVQEHLQGEQILDIGSGAGLPGIPLAIMSPAKQFTLLDGNGKKTRFMLQAASELGLKNVEVVKARVEEYRPGKGFDTVISRAFAELREMAELSARLCKETGWLYAMKGRYPEAELGQLTENAEIAWIRRLRVPGLHDTERHLVCFRLKQVDIKK